MKYRSTQPLHKRISVVHSWQLVLLYFLFFITANAQPKFNLSQIKAKYPDAEMAYLNNIQRVTIEMKDGKPVIQTLHQQDKVFLSERASIYADDRVSYSEAFEEIKGLKATSYIPQKQGFKTQLITDITTEKPSPGGGIFYDDTYLKKFTYSGAKQGGVGSLAYTEIVKNPYMMGGFIFGNYVPILNAEFSVTFPESVKVSYKTFGNMSGIQFTQNKLNGNTTYNWKVQNIKEYSLEVNAPSLRHYVPQVFLFIENYVSNNQTVEVLGDVSKLFNYYKSLVTDLNKKPDAELVALTDSITKGKPEIEKVKAVYYWVQDHIKYVAFEEGLGGFVPRQAADVCRKRYGDCKDMASLLSSMLNIAKIPAKLVWIGTRDIPYRYVENPSMAVDNHMIAAVKINTIWQFLDATDDRIDFGLPTSHIQGKEGMIMTDTDKYEIVKVPVVDAEINSRKDSILLSWKDRTLFGKGICSFEGLAKAYSKSVTQYMSEPKRTEYFENILKRGSNKCTLEKNIITGYNERDIPLKFNYVLNVPDYVQAVGNEIFINPHLTHTWEEKQIEEGRKTDIKYEYKWSEESVAVLPIPDGYELTNLPKNTNFTNPEFGFKFEYEQKNNQIIIRTKLILNTLLVKKADFPDWNKMILALNDARSEVISLKKK